jgi:hypothetical protein
MYQFIDQSDGESMMSLRGMEEGKMVVIVRELMYFWGIFVMKWAKRHVTGETKNKNTHSDFSIFSSSKMV